MNRILFVLREPNNLSRMYEWRETDSPDGTLSPLWMNPTNGSKYTIVDMLQIFIKLIKNYQTSNELDKNIQIGPHNSRKIAGAICMAHGVDLILLAKVMDFSSSTIMKENYSGKTPHLSTRCSLPGGIYPSQNPPSNCP